MIHDPKVTSMPEVIARLKIQFQLLGALISGRTMRGSRWVNRGEVIVAGRSVMLHPLDLIAIEYRGDPIGELEAVSAYFTEQAHDELDVLSDRVRGRRALAHGELMRWIVRAEMDAHLIGADADGAPLIDRRAVYRSELRAEGVELGPVRS